MQIPVAERRGEPNVPEILGFQSLRARYHLSNGIEIEEAGTAGSGSFRAFGCITFGAMVNHKEAGANAKRNQRDSVNPLPVGHSLEQLGS